MDRVIFRTFKKPVGSCDVIALLPDVEANPGMVMSYMHIGQHGEATYPGIIDMTRPADKEAYADLQAELKGIGIWCGCV